MCERVDVMQLENMNELTGYKVSSFEGYIVSVYKKTNPIGLVGFKNGSEEFFYQVKMPKALFVRGDKPDKKLEKRVIEWMKDNDLSLCGCFGMMMNKKDPIPF